VNYNSYGELIVDEHDLFDLLYTNPNLDLTKFQVQDPTQFNLAVKNLHAEFEKLKTYQPVDYAGIEDFDLAHQRKWFMPDKYKTMDIAEWVLAQCTNQEQLQRAGQELLMFQDRNLFDLLKFMKYLVDTMREHNIVWGVGRGSSVASYVLYLIGVHKIDSIYYQLDIEEFLK
jgi:DNA polymerase III alpha subunit